MEDGLGWPLVHFFLQSWGSDHLASVCLGGQGGRAQMRGHGWHDWQKRKSPAPDQLALHHLLAPLSHPRPDISHVLRQGLNWALG